MLQKLAILVTCHNRKAKTLTCLQSLYNCVLPHGYSFEVYLVDDGSTDGTAAAVKELYPAINIITGTGNLFWAGGMRFAWQMAIKKKFANYLLLNDDVFLFPFAISDLVEVHQYCIENFKVAGIYVGATTDPNTNEFSYGGYKILNNLTGASTKVMPKRGLIQHCDFANANILWVSQNVVDGIGILSDKFTHSLADFDYTHKAGKNNFPLLVSPNFDGVCENDHGNNWLSKKSTLQERIKYLKSPRHLAYNEYLYYIRKHYPYYLPISFIKLWARTLFPSIWDKYKK